MANHRVGPLLNKFFRNSIQFRVAVPVQVEFWFDSSVGKMATGEHRKSQLNNSIQKSSALITIQVNIIQRRCNPVWIWDLCRTGWWFESDLDPNTWITRKSNHSRFDPVITAGWSPLISIHQSDFKNRSMDSFDSIASQNRNGLYNLNWIISLCGCLSMPSNQAITNETELEPHRNSSGKWFIESTSEYGNWRWYRYQTQPLNWIPMRLKCKCRITDVALFLEWKWLHGDVKCSDCRIIPPHSHPTFL